MNAGLHKQLLVAAWCLLCCASPSETVAQSIPALKAAQLAGLSHRGSDSVYVINFWATWCRPCVAELPNLLTVWKKYQGEKVQLLLVSLDDKESWPEQILAFARKRTIDAPLAWLDETDADYFCNLIDRSWSGAIPATLFLKPSAGYRAFYESEFSADSFETALRKALEARR